MHQIFRLVITAKDRLAEDLVLHAVATAYRLYCDCDWAPAHVYVFVLTGVLLSDTGGLDRLPPPLHDLTPRNINGYCDRYDGPFNCLLFAGSSSDRSGDGSSDGSSDGSGVGSSDASSNGSSVGSGDGSGDGSDSAMQAAGCCPKCAGIDAGDGGVRGLPCAIRGRCDRVDCLAAMAFDMAFSNEPPRDQCYRTRGPVWPSDVGPVLSVPAEAYGRRLPGLGQAFTEA